MTHTEITIALPGKDMNGRTMRTVIVTVDGANPGVWLLTCTPDDNNPIHLSGLEARRVAAVLDALGRVNMELEP